MSRLASSFASVSPRHPASLCVTSRHPASPPRQFYRAPLRALFGSFRNKRTSSHPQNAFACLLTARLLHLHVPRQHTRVPLPIPLCDRGFPGVRSSDSARRIAVILARYNIILFRWLCISFRYRVARCAYMRLKYTIQDLLGPARRRLALNVSYLAPILDPTFNISSANGRRRAQRLAEHYCALDLEHRYAPRFSTRRLSLRRYLKETLPVIQEFDSRLQSTFNSVPTSYIARFTYVFLKDSSGRCRGQGLQLVYPVLKRNNLKTIPKDFVKIAQNVIQIHRVRMSNINNLRKG